MARSDVPAGRGGEGVCWAAGSGSEGEEGEVTCIGDERSC